MLDKEASSQYYYPICNINGCNGIAKISINENDYSLNFYCEDNDEHIKNRNFYKTLEILFQ